jgi:nitrite reductase/ring-hydroxylating ferredoxin subunit
MSERPEDRVDRIVGALLRGRRLKLRGGDAEEKEAIVMAARLAAARRGSQLMSPAFRQRLVKELGVSPREAWMTRRAALVAGLGIVAGAVGGGLLGRSLDGGGSQPSVTAGKVVQPTNGRWIDVGALADFAPGQARMVRAGAVGAFVTRDGDSSVSAVSSICSDLPCELWWDSSQHALVCPCHNRTFTAQGSSNGMYKLPSLDVVQARVNDGRVEVLGV